MVLATQERGTGRPVVLLPWFGLDHAAMMAAFEPVFATTSGWRRLYLDLPGTGRSAPVAPDSDAVLDAVRETVADLVGSASYLLAGCSYGGYLATGLARREPAAVGGMLLVCTAVRIAPADRDLTRVLPPDPEPDWLAGVPEALHGHFGLGVGHQTRAVARRMADAFARCMPTDDTYLETLRSSGYVLSDEGAARSYGGPVTILAGTRDRIAGHRSQHDALTRYPHGTLVALADAGHYLPFEQPERFATLTRDWLARATP